MWLINLLHKYFGFNKRERNGLLILLSILIIGIFIRALLPSSPQNNEVIIKKIEKPAPLKLNEPSLITVASTDTVRSGKVKENTQFLFDPNTLNRDDAKKLGFSEKLFQTLNNFRNKGGKFRKAEDLKKLYGMKVEMYKKLEPYILIPSAETASVTPIKEFKPQKDYSLIELNIADSLQLISLPGIGPGYAKKILKYRKALGGFSSKEQLKEIYGFTDSTYLKIKDRLTVSVKEIDKININQATVEEMKKHPYISYQAALSIINYRTKHGNYKKTEDLKEIGSLSESTLEKLEPYLSFD